jgi:hypothetical protein
VNAIRVFNVVDCELKFEVMLTLLSLFRVLNGVICKWNACVHRLRLSVIGTMLTLLVAGYWLYAYITMFSLQ